MIEAVDDVEQRGLAGAIGADDGADLAFADVEGNAADRLDPAEGERHVLDREQHLASYDIRPARRPHAAAPRTITPPSPSPAPARPQRRDSWRARKACPCDRPRTSPRPRCRPPAHPSSAPSPPPPTVPHPPPPPPPPS